MQPTRRARLESVILEEITVLARGIKDPRVGVVTFTSVQLTDDGSQAEIYVSPLGGITGQEEQADLAVEGLNSAAGYLRRHLAKALTVKHIPTLIFKKDLGLENTLRVHEILKKISAEKEGESDESTA